MSTGFSAQLKYGTDQKTITVQGEIATDASSISQVYITAHLGKLENQAKSSWKVGTQPETTVETIYDLDNATPAVEVKVTAGATSVPVTVSAAGATQTVAETGTTGTELLLTGM